MFHHVLDNSCTPLIITNECTAIHDMSRLMMLHVVMTPGDY
jgi:hypothetical protein